MNSLQRLRADRELPGHAQPRARRSTRRRCCAAFAYDHPVYTARGSPPSAATPRSAACAAPTTAAPTGAGASTRTACSAPPGVRAAAARRGRRAKRPVRGPESAGRVSASAVYEGWVRHRRFEPVEHDFRYRLFLHVPRPRRAARGARPLPALVGAAPRPGPLPPRRLHRRPGAAARRVRPRRGRGRDRRRPGGPVRLLASLRYLGHVLQPGQPSTTASTTAGERVEAMVAEVTNIPWGERHAYVLARGGARGPGAERRARQGAARLAVDGDGPDATRSGRASPATGSSVQIESRPRAGRCRQVVRRHPLAAPPRAEPPADGAGCCSATRRCRCRWWRRIYAQSLRLKLKGARYFPHPEGRRPKGFLSP